MTLVIDVAPEVEAKLNERARRKGMPVTDYVRTEVEKLAAAEEPPAALTPEQVAQREKNRAAIELLRSLREDGDEEEQRETGEYLRRVLDEDRPSYRKLFP